ncbi:MAG TPA: right-handed parallel beta-helix repeat-containing protein [Thermoanaerobaculia bacterium]|nr:right-handed parallel beta-helix repeat-containing protein [Thermoanaerobaculia bacterium]
MNPIRGLLLVLLAVCTFPLSAQDGDFAARIYAAYDGTSEVARVPRGAPVSFIASVERSGVEDALLTIELDVPGQVGHVGSDNCTGPQTRPIVCTFRASEFHSVQISTLLDTPGVQTATMRISSASDTRPENNVATVAVEVVDLPLLFVSGDNIFTERPRLTPGTVTSRRIFAGSNAGSATNVTLTMTLPAGGRFVAARPLTSATACSVAPDVVVCTKAQVDVLNGIGAEVDVVEERLTGGELLIHTAVAADQAAFTPQLTARDFLFLLVRHLVVSNVNDEGSGSLRQALLDARILCAESPCTIDFRIPPEAALNGVYTIRPRTPLPEVSGTVSVDGRTQTAFSGDTNPDGPEVELNGSFLTHGPGLLLGGGCQLHVFGLAINGFPWGAVETTDRTASLADCRDVTKLFVGGQALYFDTVILGNYIGVDARKKDAVPNGRGVVTTAARVTAVVDNHIASNRRSGVFAERARHLVAFNNIITGNGASGMFLDAGIRNDGNVAYGADVFNNVITNNAQWGIARTNRGDMALRGNRIFDNGYMAIDVNLDFETPNRRDDDLNAAPNRPALFSATYDAATNETVIHGIVESTLVFRGFSIIDFYASTGLSRRGQPQAELAIGGIPQYETLPVFEFTARVPGDFRGKYITATHTRGHRTGFLRPPDVSTEEFQNDLGMDTSELSNALIAQ